MRNSIFVVFAWMLLLTQVWAAVQKITIYEKPDQQGNSIILQGKHADLSDSKFFLNHTGSYCAIGIWNFFDVVNYDLESTEWEFITSVEKCGNKSFAEFNSARFAGPEDFSTPAIALYEGNYGSNYGGREYVLTGPAAANIPVVPQWTYSFGSSCWTLFTGKYFDGDSICFIPNGPEDYVATGLRYLGSTFVVQSVARGCGSLEVADSINAFWNYCNKFDN